MSLSDLRKTKAESVLGIDCSTNSVAFCVFVDSRPMAYGKLIVKGADIYTRIAHAHKIAESLRLMYKPTYIAMEAAVFVNSPQVAIKLSYVYGAVLGQLTVDGAKINTVPPVTWQSYIGNPILKAAEKNKIKAEIPGKSTTWYKNKFREFRKQRTMDYFNGTYGLSITDNDIGDACGVALYTYNTLTKR